MFRTFFFSLFSLSLCASLVHDLEIARIADEMTNARLFVTYNHLLSTGYFTTPSARMAPEGQLALGYSHVPPYRNYNAAVQLLPYLELSANYRIFSGIEDPGLSPYGFGDFSDRGANFKVGLLTPEQSCNHLPGIAFGVEDFMGSCRFTNFFVVGTQVFYRFGLEASLGWGTGRYNHGPSRGFFGGLCFFPFFHCFGPARGLSLSAEYDPINYSKSQAEPHPFGRDSSTPINYGVKYQLCEVLHVSASRIRGEEWALAASMHYNLGNTWGLPKIKDPLLYSLPVGCTRQEIDWSGAFFSQGFDLLTVWKCADHLWLRVVNRCYREELATRIRLEHLLTALVPEETHTVTVILSSYGLDCQQYTYSKELLEEESCPLLFEVLTPRQEASPPTFPPCYCHRPDIFKWQLSPRFESFLGSSAGKFKYDLGVLARVEGYLPYNLYYEVQTSYTIASTIGNLSDFDIYNPSQLPNVGTDYIRYRQQGRFSWDRLYLQRSCNLGEGLFSRFAAGYFQVNYGGVAAEALWYPTWSCFALGVEGAVVKKRNFTGLGFTSTLRQLEGTTPTFRSYSTLQQYFLSLYFDFEAVRLAGRICAGQFLAGDRGGLFEVTRYFANGLRLSGWITVTDANDLMHGVRYFNRGVAIEFPLDLFLCRSSRRVWSYGMAAWLRDAGYTTSTGVPLFEILNRERR